MIILPPGRPWLRRRRSRQRGFLINPYIFAAAGAGDPNFANVVLLLGVISGNLVDAIGTATVTVIGGGAVSSDTAIFDTQSFENPGGPSEGTNFVRCEHTGSNFVFPGQFTIEGWFNPDGIFDRCNFFGNDAFSTNGDYAIQERTPTNFLGLFVQAVVNATSSNNVLTPDVWQHIAWTRDASDVHRMFVAGVKVIEATGAGNVGRLSAGGGTISRLGVGLGIAADNSDYFGYWDEIRVTKGVCRYTADFTPPAARFPRS